MTVGTTTIRRETVGDGSTVDFTFDFKLLSSSHLYIYVDGVLNTSWSISTTLPATGGTVTFTSAPADGADIVMVRQLPLTQSSALSVTGNIPSTSIEAMADFATMQIQQLAEQLDRIPTLPITSTLDSLEFPEPGAGELIKWNDDGTALETVNPDDVLIGGTLPDPEDGSLLRWNGTTLENIAVADLELVIPPPSGDVVGPASATDHSIAFFDSTTGKLLKSALGLGSSGQKLTSQGAGTMPVWQSDAGSVLPSSIGSHRNHTHAAGSHIAVELSNGVLVTGGLAIYTARGMNSSYVPFGQVCFDSENPPAAGATIVDWAYNQGNLYVVMSDGTAYSAGQNNAGQLGHNDTTDRYLLTRIEWFVTNAVNVTNVYCGNGNIAVAIDSVFWVANDNKVYATGYNGYGQLGIGSTTNADEPTLSYDAAANTIVDIQTVRSTQGWSAMILSDGTLKMCGNNADGQLGQGNTTQQTSWVSVSGITNAVAMRCLQTTGAANIAVATSASSGSLFVWGANAYYQGANGGTSNKTSAGSALLTAINTNFFGFIGGATTIGCYCLADNGNLYTWGYNANNSLFSEGTTTRQTPTVYCNDAIVGVWGFATAAGANTGMLYALDSDNIMRFAGSAAMEAYCMFPTVADPDYTSGVYRCSLPWEIAQGDEAISDLVIQAKASGQVHTGLILTDAGSLYGCGYSTDAAITNWMQLVTQPSRMFNYRMNRFLWGV